MKLIILSGYFMHYMEYRMLNRLVRIILFRSGINPIYIGILAFVIVGLIMYGIHRLRRRN